MTSGPQFLPIGDPFDGNPSSGRDPEGAQIAVLSNGNVVLTWTDAVSPSQSNIMARIYDTATQTLGEPFIVGEDVSRLSIPTEHLTPDITALSSGGFAITWSVDDGTDTGIRAARYTADGQLIGSALQVNALSGFRDRTPEIIQLENGFIAISWTRYGAGDDQSGDIYIRSFTPLFSPGQPEFVVNNYVTGTQNFQSMTALEGGGLAVVWRNYEDEDGFRNGIYVRLFNGSDTTNDVHVNIGSLGATMPTITSLADGGFLVAWHNNARRFDADGRIVGDLITLTGTPSGLLPRVVIGLDDGGFAVLTQVGTAYDFDALRLYRYNTVGEQVGDPLEVAAGPLTYEQATAIALGNDGNLVVSWTEASVNLNRLQQGQILRMNAFPEGSVEVDGTYEEGSTLSASPAITDTDGLAGAVFAFQWMRGDTAIEGATTAQYTTTQADVGQNLSVVVTYTDDAGFQESIQSAQRAVANVNDPAEGDITFRGAMRQGETVLAEVSGLSDADGLGNFSFFWLLDGVEVAGAISRSFTFDQTHVGREIAFRVSYVDGFGTPESVTTDAVRVENVNDDPTGGVTLATPVSEDQEVQADVSTLADADGLGDLSFQWLSNGDVIAGATAQAFNPGDDQVGSLLSVRVSYTDGFGTAESVESNGVQVDNINDTPEGAVVIVGTVQEGETLSLDLSTLRDADGLGEFTYQWRSNGADISGATEAEFTPDQSLVGQTLSVRVSYTDGFGVAEAVTSAPQTIENRNDAPQGQIVLTGGRAPGNILIADVSAITDADGLGTFQYQWLRDGQVISGQVSDRYAIQAGDIGHEISLRLSYVDGMGTAEVLSSSAQLIAPPNSAATGRVDIVGLGLPGVAVYADTSRVADADGLGAYSYQWLRNGTAIEGATAETYVLQAADAGASVTVSVRFTDGIGYDEALVSGAFGPIGQPVDFGSFSGSFTATGPEIRVSEAENDAEENPYVAVLSDGRFVATWQQFGRDSLGGENIFARIFNRDGTAAGDSFVVSTTPEGSQRDPVVTALADGGFVIAYNVQGASFTTHNAGVFFQRYGADGTPVGANVEVADILRSQYDTLSMVALPGGGFAIAHVNSNLRGASQAIEIDVFDANGSLSNSFQIRPSLREDNIGFRYPRLNLTEDGQLFVAWENFGSMYARTVSLDGATQSRDRLLFDADLFRNIIFYDIETARLSNGNIAVTWRVETSTGVVFAQVFTPDGTPVSGRLTVDETSESAAHPAITALANGGFAVAWEEFEPGVNGRGYVTHVQSFGATGAPISDVTDAEPTNATATPNRGPALAAFDDGGAVLVQVHEDPRLLGVVGQFFAATSLTGGAPTEGDDQLLGAAGSDLVNALGGNDLLFGADGNDTLSGDGGDDTLAGQGGNDSLAGRLGNDHLTGGDGNDTVEGNEGQDTVLGGAGNDNLSGGDGNDAVYLGLGNDVAGGGTGNDLIVVDSAQQSDVNQAWAGTGNDTLRGNISVDRLYGGDGQDMLLGHGGNDVLIGGTTEADLRDVIFGGNGNDSAQGGYGNDELRGDAGNDTLEGGFGADTVIGGTGDDLLTAGAWGDVLFGGDGMDFINGGFGFDRVNGGAGADRFYHQGVVGHGDDWIQDYSASEGDVLMFGGGAATAGDFLVQRATTAGAGQAGVQEVFVTYVPTGDLLWALIDGAAQGQINVLAGGQTFDIL